MIPIITFYSTRKDFKTKHHVPDSNECRIIKRFIDYGYAVNVDSTKPCPTEDIRGLQGFTWKIGFDELEYASEASDGAFLLIYFNTKIGVYELEAAKSHFSGMLGLSSYSRKRVTRSLSKALGSGMFEPYRPQPCVLNSTDNREGKDEGQEVTTIVGGDRADEVTQLILSIMRM